MTQDVEHSLKTDRARYMDFLRGGAILLVIFNHAVLFTVDLIGNAPGPLQVLNVVFAPIRMPLMVFLSGLLVPRSLSKGTSRYWDGKLRMVLYAYLVWASLSVAKDFAPAALSGNYAWSMFLPIAYEPPAHTWFLYYLLIFYGVSYLTRDRVHPLLVSATALVVGIFVDGNWERFTLLLAFFMAGVWVARHPRLIPQLVEDRRVLLVSALVSAAFVVTAVFGVNLRYETLAAPIVVAGILLSIKFGQWATAKWSTRMTTALEYIGRQSLVFYLVHFFAVLVAVLLIQRLFAVPNGWIMILSGFAAGLGASAVVAVLVDNFPTLRWFFEVPRRKTNRM